MRIVPTVSVLAIRPLLALLATGGVTGAAFLERIGVRNVDPGDDDARLPIHRLISLWSRAETLLGDDDVGLHAAEHATFESFGVLGVVAASSATVGAGLAHVVHFVSYVSGMSTYSLTRDADIATLSLVRHRWMPVLRHPAEYVLAIPHLYCARASTHPWSLIDVTFSHQTPRSTKEHARIFGCPVSFGAAHDSIRFSASLLESPSRFRDDTLTRALTATQEQLARRTPVPDTVAAARICIWERLRAGDASIAGAASAMAMSERTFQRELSAHGTSHRMLLDEIRAAFATELLRDGVTLLQVALLLGFSEQTAFQRAFKRWTGKSPARFRRGS